MDSKTSIVYNTRARAQRNQTTVRESQTKREESLQGKIFTTNNQRERDLGRRSRSIERDNLFLSKSSEENIPIERSKSVENNKRNKQNKAINLSVQSKDFIKVVMGKNENQSETMESEDLSSLIKLLAMKIAKEDENQNKTNITIDNFAKIISDFDGSNIPARRWFETFEENAEAYELSEKQKYVHARNKMVNTAKLFLETVSVSDYSGLKEAIIEEFGKKLHSDELHKLLSSKTKKDDESFHDYCLKMKKVAALGDIEDISVIHYIVNGLKIRNELKCQLYSATSFKELREKYDIFEKMNLTSELSKSFNKQYTKKYYDKSAGLNKKRCFNCGSKDHKKADCKTEPKCFKCNNYGHIAKNCRNNSQGVNKEINVIVNEKRFKTITLNKEQLDCFIDTGSDVCLMKFGVYKNKFRNCVLKENNSRLSGLCNVEMKPYGCIKLRCKIDNFVTNHDFLIVSNNTLKHDVLIGYDFISKCKMLVDSNGYKFEDGDVEKEDTVLNVFSINAFEIDSSGKYKNQIQDLIAKYKPTPVVEECPVVMKVVPNGEIKPFRHSPSRLPIQEETEVKRQVENWLEKGIVRKSCSDIASRVVVTKKKSGEYRVCVDFRQLNSMVLKDGFPVPIVEDIIQQLHNVKFFCTMDLENGFFHVPIEESSKKYTAFVTKQGLFEFNRAPFGFCNSPAYFIRYVNYIFQELVNGDIMQLYMDDIVIYGESEEVCFEKLKMVLDVAARFNLKFKWSKCAFMKTKIDFLGHTIQNGSIWPGKLKTRAVAHFPMPKTIKDVQSFIGLTGYFRKFIPNYAHIARPLKNLFKKESIFKMEANEINAVTKLKSLLVSEPVLRIFCREAETELHTDASKDGFGATLLQKFEGQLHPVFFYSKKTSEQESRLHSFVLEVKAAYLAFKKFRDYILGIPFKLVTDCSAFKQTTTKKDVPRDVAQWIMYFQEFNYTVEHRTANRMKHVDALSRHPVDILIIASEMTSRFLKQQREDDGIRAIAQALTLGPYENFKLKGELVYKTVDGNDLLMVPRLMEVEVIKNAHEVGHFATQKTIHAVQQQYYIPHLTKKVNQVVNNCVKCIIHNKKLGRQEGLLNCIDKGDTPLHTIHVDHLGPMDSTSKQYKYIFSLVDGFSKFIWLFPTKTTAADEVIKKLIVWSDNYGYPNRIISDKGAAFTSQNFQEFCKQNGIEHISTTTGVPRGNGQIERVNRSILSIISKLSDDDPNKWYKKVGEVQKAVNSCMHSSTKSTPFQIMFGVKMKNSLSDNMLQLLENELIQRFDEERQHLRNDAKAQIQMAQSNYKKNFDKKRKDYNTYQFGDLVAVKRTQFVAGKKLAQEYVGPYKVVKVKRNGRYDVEKVANVEGPKKTSTSADYMKPWRDDEAVEYVLSSGSDDDQEGRM